MERQAAARIAFEFGINTSFNGVCTLREALTNSEAIYQWIANGTIPPVSGTRDILMDGTEIPGEPAPVKSEPAKAPTQSKAESVVQHVETVETPKSAEDWKNLKSANKSELPPMTRVGDLLNWAYKLKPSVSSSEVCKIAGVKDATQITDYKGTAQKILDARKTP